MYGKQSQQQSIQAKLLDQGGVEGAVEVDSTEQYADAQAQKASAQSTVDKTRLEKSLDGNQTQMKVDNLYTRAGKEP
ncbi:MAG: hypothetical protein COA39_011070 [Sulfurimonas sp.]|nr:hypothetical protein [Sulfurimonas sp.]